MGDRLDEPFGSFDGPPFFVFNIVFTLFSRQIKMWSCGACRF